MDNEKHNCCKGESHKGEGHYNQEQSDCCKDNNKGKKEKNESCCKDNNDMNVKEGCCKGNNQSKDDCCKNKQGNDDCCKKEKHTDEHRDNSQIFDEQLGMDATSNDEVTKLKKQNGELKETLQRVFADFQNFKKRTEEERVRVSQLSTEDIIKNILPLLDDFERALTYKTQDDEFSKGVEMIHAQLLQLIQDEGVKFILPTGKFNPKLHEAIMAEESNKEEGTILAELQRGYMLAGKVIRHSKVKIAKQKAVGGK